MNFFAKPSIFGLVFFSALLSYSVANAQSFISTIALNNANLNTTEFQRYSTLQQDAFTKDLKLANFSNPRNFVDAQGKLQFEFPTVQGVIEAQAIDISQTETSYSWTGQLLNHAGYFGFYEISGRRAAWLQIDTRFFEVMPIRSGVNTIREIDGDVLDSGNCLHPTTEQNTNSGLNLCEKEYNTCAATIDILVLLPPDATNWLHTRFGNDQFTAPLYVGIGTQALNAAYINSDIPNKRANIILENFSMTYPNGTACDDLLNALVTQATSRRNAVGADLVVLLTANADYNCGSGAACAELGDPPNLCDPSFTFSEMRWLVHPRWSMLHEVGHLTGAGHDRPHDNDPDCAHGWTVDGNRFQRTLMAAWIGTQNPTDTRILHYSNPDVEFNGDPTGTAVDNNAKAIRNGACTVANYRQRYVFNASIITDPFVCRPDLIYLDAVVLQPSAGNPGTPPYTYDWRWNFSGNFSGGSGTFLGNTQAVTFASPASGDHIWVQLKVRSSDGLGIIQLKQIEILDAGDPKCKRQRRNERSVSQEDTPAQKLLLIPNPANSAVEVKWSSSLDGEVAINIFDGMGRLTIGHISRQRIGENNYYIDIKNLSTGIYGVTLRSENGVMYQKLIVNH